MKYLISAGPTREKIDPVRFLSNRSSGKMGYALAEAARMAGHRVTLVSGPVNLPPPPEIEPVYVESAAEMAEAVKKAAVDADVIIMAAAVADYRPIKVLNRKMKKSEGTLSLELERTEDILATLGKRKKNGQTLVGFAAETDSVTEYARDKLIRKNLDWIVANDVGKPGQGFVSDNNAAIMIPASGEPIEFPLQTKTALAAKIIAALDRTRQSG